MSAETYGSLTVLVGIRMLRVLGQVEVVAEAAHHGPFRGRVADVLTALALAAPQSISNERLVEQVWPDAAVGVGALHTTISRTRSALGEFASAIERTSTGYRLTLGSEQVDVAHFRHAWQQASAAARRSDWGLVDDATSTAMALWRDDPFAGRKLEGIDTEAELLWQLYADVVDAATRASLEGHGTIPRTQELVRVLDRYELRVTSTELLARSFLQRNDYVAALQFLAKSRTLHANAGLEPPASLNELETAVLVTIDNQDTNSTPAKSPTLEPTDLRDRLVQASQLLAGLPESGDERPEHLDRLNQLVDTLVTNEARLADEPTARAALWTVAAAAAEWSNRPLALRHCVTTALRYGLACGDVTQLLDAARVSLRALWTSEPNLGILDLIARHNHRDYGGVTGAILDGVEGAIVKSCGLRI